MGKTPVCRACGGKVLYGDLHCSVKCRDGQNVLHDNLRSELEKRGFVRDPEISNVYLKDGVATTVEHLAHVGMVEALRQHEAAVANRRA